MSSHVPSASMGMRNCRRAAMRMTNGDGRGFSLRREGRQVSNQRGEFTERVCPKGAIESQLEVGEAETAFCDAALKQIGHVLAFGIGSEQLRCGRVEQERWGSGPRADRRELGPHGDKVDAGGDDPADIEENRQQNQEKNPPGLVAADLVERRRGPPGSINDRPERNAEGNENTDSDEKETLHLTCLRERHCALYVRHGPVCLGNGERLCEPGEPHYLTARGIP
jgi:hypothetical protein